MQMQTIFCGPGGGSVLQIANRGHWQMSHHGHSGVSEAFYRPVAPKICLDTAPDWLWDNDQGDGLGSGPWKTMVTRGWMEKPGIE